MSPDELALRAAVIAAPDDDTVRLVYADWLEENGEPERAEFVRVQCELARREAAVDAARATPVGCCGRYADYMSCDCPSGPEVATLRRRGRELLSRHWIEWAFGPGDPGWPPGDPGWPISLVGGWACYNLGARGDKELEFRRGFVDSVRCPAAAWVRHGDAVRKHHPVERVTLATWPEVETCQNASGASVGWRLVGDPDPDWCLPFDAVNRPAGKTTAQVVCAARWPGVAFVMPPVFDAVTLTARRMFAQVGVTPELVAEAGAVWDFYAAAMGQAYRDLGLDSPPPDAGPAD